MIRQWLKMNLLRLGIRGAARGGSRCLVNDQDFELGDSLVVEHASTTSLHGVRIDYGGQMEV
ncbi:MAG: hypothetical protein M2R45_03017 [Verrucomicrobia subdivision 3 bacterium]|nr:hypothetical protein [Limisphaerales bacterium]MCS1415537.1 hypothetical protein [Limisphaerales bacterium]